MPTPLEDRILDDFEELITTSDAIPDGLTRKLMAHVRGDRAPGAEVLFETIKGNVGDQSVSQGPRPASVCAANTVACVPAYVEALSPGSRNSNRHPAGARVIRQRRPAHPVPV